jgi:hypothetical protein
MSSKFLFTLKPISFILLICSIKIRRAPATRHDNVDFKSIVIRTSLEIKPLFIVVADKGYDSEEDHVFVREEQEAYSIIPPRSLHVPFRGRMIDIENK